MYAVQLFPFSLMHDPESLERAQSCQGKGLSATSVTGNACLVELIRRVWCGCADSDTTVKAQVPRGGQGGFWKEGRDSRVYLFGGSLSHGWELFASVQGKLADLVEGDIQPAHHFGMDPCGSVWFLHCPERTNSRPNAAANRRFNRSFVHGLLREFHWVKSPSRMELYN